MIFIYLIDLKQKQNWFSAIKPAGTSTLTAYLLPYIHYAIYNIFFPVLVLPIVIPHRDCRHHQIIFICNSDCNDNRFVREKKDKVEDLGVIKIKNLF